MFEVGFTELILICALALIVLGPQRLPKLASQIGRWVGRARAMARQLRDQLDQEMNFADDPPRGHAAPPSPPAAPEPDEYPASHHDEQSHRDASEHQASPETLTAPESAAETPAEPTQDPHTSHERSGP